MSKVSGNEIRSDSRINNEVGSEAKGGVMYVSEFPPGELGQ